MNQDILDQHFHEEENRIVVINEAAKEKRFVNYIIDRILFMGVLYGMGYLLSLIGSEAIINWLIGVDLLTDILVSNLLYIIFYTAQEYFLDGKTIGKYLTRTRVLCRSRRGQPPTFLQYLGRSAARVIPFNTLSFLGDRGWHDSLSDTIVIDEASSQNYLSLDK